VVTLAKNHPDFEKHPLMEELIMDIMEADHRVLYHRIRYDRFCQEYNHLVSEEREVLGGLGKENLNEMPIFTLSE